MRTRNTLLHQIAERALFALLAEIPFLGSKLGVAAHRTATDHREPSVR